MSKEQYFPFPRELDPQLYDLYTKMLPVRGWAGHLPKEATAGTKDALKRGSAKLRKGVVKGNPILISANNKNP